MSASVKTAICSTGLLAMLAGWSAQAADATGVGCEPVQQTIVQVMGKGDITTYDEAGEFSGRVPGASIVTGVLVLACRDVPSRQVKLQVKDKQPVWVDALQVKIAKPEEPGKAEQERACKQKAPSDRNDVRRPAVSGIDPCSG